MPSSYLTELALRSAVNTNDRELTSQGGQADAIKSAALKRSQDLIQGNSNTSTSNLQLGIEAAAITAAIVGITIAYKAISKQMSVLKNQRLSFDQERQAGIATFMMPIDKEESNLSKEEKVIKGFLELSFKNPSFSSYLGIHSAELLTNKGSKFNSVLPFYRMSEGLSQPIASTKPLDRQRTSINLFFRSALPDAIADIEDSFQTDWQCVSFWESAYQRKNYLNNRRAPRFIMMSLSNLLWNLQHPVDPISGYPLNISRCIEICRDAELYLIQLLNTESPPYLINIHNDENEIFSFMRRLEFHVKALRAAYVDEQLHELNVEEITNSAHSALRIMDKSIFKLVYKRYNPVAKKFEPDDKAAESLADTVSYLNLLLIRNATLLDAFLPLPTWLPQTTTINRPPQTVVDVLIIFCHLSWRERDQLLERIEKINMDSAVEFAKTLKKFDARFVKPIKDVSKKELNATVFSPKHQDVSRLTARRLVPLIALVVKDYQVELDTPLSTERAKISQRPANNTPNIWSGKQQIQAINTSAELGGGYYTWALSPFIIMSAEVAAALDELPKRQYRMTQMTELLDNVGDLVQHYRSFLQNKSFQTFLLKCLNKVKEEYADLDRHIEKVDECLAQDERMSRGLQSILRPMTRDLTNSLDGFMLATNNFERIVSLPDFTENERQLLATKLSTVSNQFSLLFAQDSGITSLIDMPAIALPSRVKTVIKPNFVEVRKVVALKKLVEHCYNALSYQSSEGHKGSILRELLNLIEEKPTFNEKEIKHVIMELARVTASYRETWIFQAAYGNTRSARALIAAIKDPILNEILPLASIIFGQSNMNMMEVSDAQILHRLKNLREGNHWQESSEKIKLLSFSTS